MVGNSAHAIGRQLWEIEVSSEELALALRPRLSDWNRRHWLPCIEATLEDLDLTDHQIRIGRLELDLGVVTVPHMQGRSLQALERDLRERLEARLRSALSDHIRGLISTDGAEVASASNIEIVPVEQAQVELFEHFLLRGFLPFWASRRNFRFGDLLQHLSDTNPVQVVQTIRRHGHRQRTLHRLVAQLDRDAFHKLLTLLEPAQAALLVAYLLDIERLHRHRPLIAMDSRRLGHSLAVLTLAFLVNDRGSRFNRKSYVRSLILGLARARGIVYSDLLRTIGRCLEWVTTAGTESRALSLTRSSLPALLLELLADLDDVVPEQSGTDLDPLNRLRIELLGNLPHSYADALQRDGGGALRTDRPELGGMWLVLAGHHAPSARRFLQSLRLRHVERRAMMKESTPEVFQTMMQILAPDDADRFNELAEALGRIPTPYRPRHTQIREAILREVLGAGSGRRLNENVIGRILRRLFESPLPEPVARSLDLEIDRVPPLLPEAARLALRRAMARAAGREPDVQSLAETPAPSIQEQEMSRNVTDASPMASPRKPPSNIPSPRRSRPAEDVETVFSQTEKDSGNEAALQEEMDSELTESDTFYLDNAGLILIAPFLPRLLEQLEVLEDGKIRDLECASCAVHLLQYLVDGRLDASEPELVLPKILCGWPLQEPVLMSFDPPDTQLALCDSLLNSLIEHWPSLQGSSAAALQQTFLQRPGRLESAETDLRLTVEGSSFDVLMKDVPWSFSLIIHAAMDRPIHVSW